MKAYDNTGMVKQSDEEASQTARLLCRKERAASRGSLRSSAAQQALARDDKAGHPSSAAIVGTEAGAVK